MGGGSSAGVLAGAWAPGGMWMLLKLVVGADGPGPGLKPIPGAGPGPKLWSWLSWWSLKEPPWERPWPEKPSAPNSSSRETEGEKAVLRLLHLSFEEL